MRNITRIKDLGNEARISKYGHAHTKPFIRYVQIGVIDRQVIKMPPDSQVLGVAAYLGELYLKIEVHPIYNEITVPRFFYAFANGEYMKMTNLAFVDTVKVGGYLWFVFEDDMYPPIGD